MDSVSRGGGIHGALPKGYTPIYEWTTSIELPETSRASKTKSGNFELLAESTSKSSRLQAVKEGMNKFGKGAAAVLGGACAIVGGGAAAIAMGIVVLAAIPGLVVGAGLGAGIGALAGLANKNASEGAAQGARVGATAGALVAAVPVALALCIPCCIGFGLAKAGDKLLAKASGKSASDTDAWPLQKFAAKFKIGNLPIELPKRQARNQYL